MYEVCADPRASSCTLATNRCASGSNFFQSRLCLDRLGSLSCLCCDGRQLRVVPLFARGMQTLFVLHYEDVQLQIREMRMLNTLVSTLGLSI